MIILLVHQSSLVHKSSNGQARPTTLWPPSRALGKPLSIKITIHCIRLSYYVCKQAHLKVGCIICAAVRYFTWPPTPTPPTLVTLWLPPHYPNINYLTKNPFKTSTTAPANDLRSKPLIHVPVYWTYVANSNLQMGPNLAYRLPYEKTQIFCTPTYTNFTWI